MFDTLKSWYERRRVSRERDRRDTLSTEAAEEEYRALLAALQGAKEAGRLLSAARSAMPMPWDYAMIWISGKVHRDIDRVRDRVFQAESHLRREELSYCLFLHWRLESEGRVDGDHRAWIARARDIYGPVDIDP